MPQPDPAHPTVTAWNLRTFKARYADCYCAKCRAELMPGEAIALLPPERRIELYELGYTKSKTRKYVHIACLPILLPEPMVPAVVEAAQLLASHTDPRWPQDELGFSKADAAPLMDWLGAGTPRLYAGEAARRLRKYIGTQLGGPETRLGKAVLDASNYRPVKVVGGTGGSKRVGSAALPTGNTATEQVTVNAKLDTADVVEEKRAGAVQLKANGKGLKLILDPPWENESHAVVKDTLKSRSAAAWDPEAKCWRMSAAQVADNWDVFAGVEITVTPGAAKRLRAVMERKELASAASLDEAAAEMRERLTDLFPAGFALYPYQEAGVAFIEAAEGRALVGDEMGCIDGAAEVTVNRGGKGFRISLADLQHRFHGGKTRNGKRWDPEIPTYIRSLCNGEFRRNLVLDVLDKGVRPVVKLTLASGKMLRLTADHEVCVATDAPHLTSYTEAQNLHPGALVITNGQPVCPSCGGTEDLITYRYAKFRGYCRTCMYRKMRRNGRTDEERKRVYRMGHHYLQAGLKYHPNYRRGGIAEHRLVVEADMNQMSLDAWLEVCRTNAFTAAHVFLDPTLVVHHKSGNYLDNRLENLEVLSVGAHHQAHQRHRNLPAFAPKQDEVIAIESDGEAHVYDVVCANPHRNLVANGVVVHNCGKTIQAIAYLALHPALRPVLVVVPAVVAPNWQREFETWLPATTVYRVKKTKDPIPTNAEIVIVTYDMARRRVDELAGRKFQAVISDESHYLKNNKAARTKAVLTICKKTKAKSVLCLSGTPLINRPVEFYTTLNLLRPTDYRNWKRFTERYCAGHYESVYVKGGMRRDVWVCDGSSNLDELNQRLSDVMVRRLKCDVLTELPPKTHIDTPVELNPKERASYNRAVKSAYAALDEKEPGAHLVAITAARQAVGVAKVRATVDWVKEYVEQGQYPVMFAHHKGVRDAMVDAIRTAGITVGHIDGQVPQDERQRIVDAFQAGKTDCLVISIKAGGVGITLTRSSNVIIAERAWTPGDEQQAEDRTHRIGQTDPVTVRVLHADVDIDHDMAELLTDKALVIQAALDGDGTVPADTDIRKELVARWAARRPGR